MSIHQSRAQLIFITGMNEVKKEASSESMTFLALCPFCALISNQRL